MADPRDLERLQRAAEALGEMADESQPDVRAYLREQFRELLVTDAFVVSVDGHLGGDAARAAVVCNRLAYLAGTMRLA
jgi:hypothetical protein